MGEEKRLAAWVTPSGAGVFVLALVAVPSGLFSLFTFCLFRGLHARLPPLIPRPAVLPLPLLLARAVLAVWVAAPPAQPEAPGSGSSRSAVLGSHPRASKRASLGVSRVQSPTPVLRCLPSARHTLILGSAPQAPPTRGHMSDSQVVLLWPLSLALKQETPEENVLT